jgi:serine/threonine protein kinase
MVSHSHHGSHGSSKEGTSSAGKSSATPKATPVKEKWQLERHPGKDGSAQRMAADVAGLKGYQLGDCLGKGAFGSVYKALNWGTGGTVAIKQVGLSHLPKTELKNMMQEIDLLKNLHHPNIVKYHGFVTSTENLYIILEYCEGGSLSSLCKSYGKFPETLVALYLSQVLQGLLYLHEQGVIHRDIKGANILTMRDGLVKLADFGVATKGNVGEFSVVGTPYWMAPEVIQLSGASTASDIWSLGCTALELLEGRPPYSNFQPMPALFRIVNDDHPPLPEGASPVVRDFLMQCFQKDPNLRVSAKKLLKHPWIVNAKRADMALTAEPNAKRAVEEWNDALRSPEGEQLRLQTRQASLSPAPAQRESKPLQLKTPGFAKAGAHSSKASLDALASPELDTDDNWDLDFDPPTNPGGLQLQRLKPQDNFAGLFSHDRLKSLAVFGSVAEDTIEEEPDLTIRSPANLFQSGPLETVRPFTPQKKKKPEIKSISANTGSQRIPSQPKVQPLRESACKVNLPAGKLRLTTPAPRPTSIYQEESDEDFSDMLDDEDDAAFLRKVQELRVKEEQSFSPRLFHPSDLANPPRPVANGRKNGSLRRYPTPEEHKTAITGSRSSVEIQKYAEDENEDPEDFLGKDVVLPLHDSDSGSEPSTLMMLNSKLSTNSWLGDEEDEDDPFAQLEEDFDELDLETNIARDRYARLCKFVEDLVGEIKISKAPDMLAQYSEQLMQVLIESPELKGTIVSSHGMLPILEILDNAHNARTPQDVILRLLKIVNMIIYENEELMETLCFLGGIPIISRYADQRVSGQIRLEAAAFVRQMCQGSTLTLQMFIGCGGLNVLCDFLEEDLETERDLVLIGVMGVYNVFELQVSRTCFYVRDMNELTEIGINTEERFLQNTVAE